jgi:hypothetical protein
MKEADEQSQSEVTGPLRESYLREVESPGEIAAAGMVDGLLTKIGYETHTGYCRLSIINEAHQECFDESTNVSASGGAA